MNKLLRGLPIAISALLWVVIASPCLSQKAGTASVAEQRPCVENAEDRASELCAQWSTADAAEKAARWAGWQFAATILGTLGLGLTLFFNWRAITISAAASRDSNKALEAALKSADATFAAAKAAADNVIAFQASERAHLRLKVGNGYHANDGFIFTIAANNVGRSNAIVTDIDWEFTDIPKKPILVGQLANVKIEVTVAEKALLHRVLMSNHKPFIYVAARYRTIFGTIENVTGMFKIIPNEEDIKASFMGGPPFDIIELGTYDSSPDIGVTTA